VDDLPNNNVNERQALEAMGITFTLVRSTPEALQRLSEHSYSSIISDIGRPEGKSAGYALLTAIGERGISTPFFLYTGGNAAKYGQEIQQRGGQGSTNSPQELFRMVVRTVLTS
jgi:CheY-like chemotaxis protein